MKLICGEALETLKTMEDNSVDAVICDPPYGTTQCKWDTVISLEDLWKQLNRIVKPTGAVVITAAQPFTTTLIGSNIQNFKYCWIWDKGQGTGFLNAKKQPLRNCEDIVVFYRKQCTYNPVMREGFKPYTVKQGDTKTQNYGKQTGAVTVSDGTRYPLTLINFTRDKSKLHPTQKPVALMEYLVKTYTDEGETVLDFAMGSGSTGVACKNLNRDFIGIDMEQEYVDIAITRIEQA